MLSQKQTSFCQWYSFLSRRTSLTAVLLLQKLRELPSWQQHDGLDFGIHIEHPYLPDEIVKSACQLSKALLLHPEATIPYTCRPPRSPSIGLVLPYPSPSFWLDPQRPPKQRTKLLFFIGVCAGVEESDAARVLGNGQQGLGKHMRGKVVRHLQQMIPDGVDATIS